MAMLNPDGHVESWWFPLDGDGYIQMSDHWFVIGSVRFTIRWESLADFTYLEDENNLLI